MGYDEMVYPVYARVIFDEQRSSVVNLGSFKLSGVSSNGAFKVDFDYSDLLGVALKEFLIKECGFEDDGEGTVRYNITPEQMKEVLEKMSKNMNDILKDGIKLIKQWTDLGFEVNSYFDRRW